MISGPTARFVPSRVGGAVVVPGHGLDGVARRMQGLGGSFTLASPAGGPTTITLRIPLTDWSNRA